MKSSAPKTATKTAKKAAKKTPKKTAQPAAASASENDAQKPAAQSAKAEQNQQGQKIQKKKKDGPDKKKKNIAPGQMKGSVEADLAVEAHHLRIVLREISSRFISDLESAIVRIVDMVGEVPDKQKQAELRDILKQMHSLRLKPQKGRLGDLRRIRNLVERVNSRLDEII